MTGVQTSALPIYKGEGKVEKIGKDSVTISHGPIPTLQMGAMTMEFKAPKSGVPTSIKEGGMVTFELMMTPKGEMALGSIQPITAPIAAPSAAAKAVAPDAMKSEGMKK